MAKFYEIDSEADLLLVSCLTLTAPVAPLGARYGCAEAGAFDRTSRRLQPYCESLPGTGSSGTPVSRGREPHRRRHQAPVGGLFSGQLLNCSGLTPAQRAGRPWVWPAY